jgi:hypothetical protein
MLTIATVLKSGGDFKAEHVLAIRDMCSKFMPEHRFVCLSDVEVDCEVIPMEFDWPKWWPKFELFRQSGPLLYIDLDTVIVGDCSELLSAASGKRFVILRDFSYPTSNRFGGGLIYWKDDMRFVFDEFVRKPNFKGRDDMHLETVIPMEMVTFWQDIVPENPIVSFKKSVRNRSVPDGCKIICFHGPPRPWQQKIVKYP